MRRFSKNIFWVTQILILSIALILSAFLLTGCAKDKDLNANPIRTAEEWNRAVENSYDSLVAPKASYILETSFGDNKTYTVSGDKCKVNQNREQVYYYHTEASLFVYRYEKGKGYLRKETENKVSSMGEFVLNDVLSASSLEDFNSLKDCFGYFSAKAEGVYTLNGNSEVLFAQKVFGEEASAEMENLDVSVTFDQGLINGIVILSRNGENTVTKEITIVRSYRTVTLPTYKIDEA